MTSPLLPLAQPLEAQRSEEPPVLAADVPLLECLLDRLLGLLTLRNLLKGVVGHDALEALELECVTSGHDVVVVDDLDERLDLVALGLALLAHASRHGERVALDTGDKCVREGVGLAAVVLGLDDHNL